jgi:hypothetical protein
MKGYIDLLISVVQSRLDGRDGFSSLDSAWEKIEHWAPWLLAMEKHKLWLWGKNQCKVSSYVI